MNAIDYEILRCVFGNPAISQRAIAAEVGVSLGKVNKSLGELKRVGYVNDELCPTASANELIAACKPKSAVILAAGRGLRLIPLCRDIPKALLEVKGELLIERLIRQLHEVGITDIHVVVGYMKEKFTFLVDKYRVKLVVNTQFDNRNNMYSLFLASHALQNCYIVPCDLYCEQNPFRKTETYSWYMVADKPSETSLVAVNRNRELVVVKEGTVGHKEIGIAYVGGEQSEQLKSQLNAMQAPAYYASFWEGAAVVGKKMMLLARCVPDEMVREINTYDDLVALDAGSESLDSEYIRVVCDSLHVKKEDISHVTAQKAGMTNRSFLFCCNGKQYIFRIPGEGTDRLINRKQEFDVYQQIRDKNICDEIVYINPENGHKITRFIDNAVNCDPTNPAEVEKCMRVLRNFHEMKLTVDHRFDIFEQLLYYEKLRGERSIYDDYERTKQQVMELKSYIDSQDREQCLCHIDSVCDNFIFSNDHIYLIDWEYAGMQDPHVDIAMFAIYAMYEKEQCDQLIDFYFQGNCDVHTRLKIYCYIAVCGLLWSNWCEYKASLGELFGEYSLRQYQYAKDFYRYFKEGITDASC